MATATVDHHHHHNHLRLNSLPLIDIRLLSHSELLSLSRCSSTTTISDDDEDQDSTPKIDASVFNESAGSRKQTFSRLRLAPRNSSPIRPQIPPPPSTSIDNEDNPQVVSLLKSLLHIESHSFTPITVDDRLFSVPVEFEEAPNNDVHIGPVNIPVELVTCSETKRKRGRPRKDDDGNSRWVISIESKVNEETLTPASSIIYEKRKRGRPRKMNIENNALVVSPVETGKRKRGRPRSVAIVSGVNGSENSQNMSMSNGVGVACETRKRKPGRPRKEESVIMRGNGNEMESRNGVVDGGGE